LLGLGLTAAIYVVFSKKQFQAPALKSWTILSLAAIPCYFVFQLIPFPISIVQVLSPARGALVAALGPVIPGVSSSPLSVNPSATLLALSMMMGYIAICLLTREISWRTSSRPWLTLTPILCFGFLEAGIGMFQVLTAAIQNPRSSGSFSNWDHFAGFLELILPISVVFGLACLRRNQHQMTSFTPGATISACAVWAGSIMILVSIIYSLSRTGFVVALVSLFIVAILCLNLRQLSRTTRLCAAAGLTLLVLGMFVFLPPEQLVERFAGLSSSDKLIADARPDLWRESLSLISEYPLFGVGTGGFEATFTKHQATALGLRVEFAHNDYLQYLAEFGLVGFSILLTALLGLLIPLAKGLKRFNDPNHRLVAIGCIGSVCALALHSLVDFNSYVPATAMTIAWIIGVGSANGIPVASRVSADRARGKLQYP
jgi:O-antigen ligase